MNKGRLSRVEEQIEYLVEGSFARLFAGRLSPREVATHLARAIEDNVRPEEDGSLSSPTLFTISLNNTDYEALKAAQPDLEQQLCQIVIGLANHADLRLSALPTLRIMPRPTIPPRAVKVVAAHNSPLERSTQVLDQTVVNSEPEHHPHNPQLILNGTRYVPLDRPVMNIGRRRDNHIVIDDLRISRLHAQLRLRFGHFVLYDLGSSGGTRVNERAVTECILKPGDVISLAGVPMVYIEDEISTGQTGNLKDTAIRPPGETGTRLQEDNDPTL